MTSALETLRARICDLRHAGEPAVVEALLQANTLDASQRDAVTHHAVDLVKDCREMKHKAGTLDAFLQEFGLSNKEGIALMCLAESLLRVPDEETADRLIAEKIRSGNWASHRGQSDSGFVNAAVWGLMLTGRVVSLDKDVIRDTGSWMMRLVSSLGEPVVRRAILQAMRIMGGQYVLGRTIQEAMRKGEAGNPAGTRFSFDMLGEGARTEEDAQRYFTAYAKAIEAICAHSSGNRDSRSSAIYADGISVKLSALHARYEFRQLERVNTELLPRVKALALMAKQGGIGFSIDAEEADRLELSLDLFEALARDPELAGWDGLGFVLQAYQKRATAVAQWLVELANDCQRRFTVRLVKGAYWDGEIKHAQEQGVSDYPVFTRKSHSDLSYQICAQILLSSPVGIYPQFATHNAHTVAMIQGLVRNRQAPNFEFQRLHGMGQLLYQQVLDDQPDTPIRVYAPVGSHKDLLPYLVRRLLENGANSSFVNRFLDAKVSPQALMTDPYEETRSKGGLRHSAIPLPGDLYQKEVAPWRNAAGFDLTDHHDVEPLLTGVKTALATPYNAGPIVSGEVKRGQQQAVKNPSRPALSLGHVVTTTPDHIEAALQQAEQAQRAWNAIGTEARAERLERAADLMEQHTAALIGLIVTEAGRTIDDALSELREAIDFCRYYAQQARIRFGTVTLPGPTGEVNSLSYTGRGTFLCISPWNFPLAIFVGQVAAALVSGNCVIAKPAEQTPLIAARAVELLIEAGVPAEVIHLLPGDGKVGAALVADPRISGVVFTGSTQTARHINLQLAQREGPIAPLIAETGGLNAMLVDATALPEQVVDDVITSAFQSAGQRCSALRVLFIQEDIADGVIHMLQGAMQELSIGDPALLSTDIGPVIDEVAQHRLTQHIQRMKVEAKLIAACDLDGSKVRDGYFVAPHVFELERLSQLEQEVFGPILHIIRYSVSDIPKVLQDINTSGYGLTLGVHSRIDGFARQVFNATRVGNTYVNRNMVGAVVGVNPFGGQGLSGTGPKAGGPNYLMRFVTEKTYTDNVVAKGGNTQLFTLQE